MKSSPGVHSRAMGRHTTFPGQIWPWNFLHLCKCLYMSSHNLCHSPKCCMSCATISTYETQMQYRIFKWTFLFLSNNSDCHGSTLAARSPSFYLHFCAYKTWDKWIYFCVVWISKDEVSLHFLQSASCQRSCLWKHINAEKKCL